MEILASESNQEAIMNEMNDKMNENDNDNGNGNNNVSMINFLEDVVVKSKRLGHNKLQNQIEKYIQQIQTYENEIMTLKNNLENLKKEKIIQIELNEKQKNDFLNMTNNYNDLLSKYNELNISLSTERTTHNNIRLSYENQIQKATKAQESLNIELLHQQNMFNDIQKKFDEIKTRHDELTSLYSKQTFENDILKRELNNAKDELNTTSSNNKKLYDELQTIRNEANYYKNELHEFKNNNYSTDRDLLISPSPIPSPPTLRKGTPVLRGMPASKDRRSVAVNRR